RQFAGGERQEWFSASSCAIYTTVYIRIANHPSKPSLQKKSVMHPIKELTQELERMKAQVRSKVEHPFHIVKNLFGFEKVRYRGLAKNIAQLCGLLALANLVIA